MFYCSFLLDSITTLQGIVVSSSVTFIVQCTSPRAKKVVRRCSIPYSSLSFPHLTASLATSQSQATMSGNVYSMASQASAPDIGPPAFEPGKPWRGLKNIEEDPHATPGSISTNLSISRCGFIRLLVCTVGSNDIKSTRSFYGQKPLAHALRSE